MKKNNLRLNEENHGIPENKYNKHAWIAGKNLEIGEDVWIGAFTLIDGIYANLKIGKGCNISSGAQILTHSTVRRTISERKKKIEFAPVEIGEYCFIGTNAVILMGTKIGHHSVIGAGCVILEKSKIPSYSIMTGVPGRITGSSKKFLKTKK